MFWRGVQTLFMHIRPSPQAPPGQQASLEPPHLRQMLPASPAMQAVLPITHTEFGQQRSLIPPQPPQEALMQAAPTKQGEPTLTHLFATQQFAPRHELMPQHG